MKYVPGMGAVGAKLVIVGESPTHEDTELGKPFTGPTGRELSRLMVEAGANVHEAWLTNVSKYYVPPNVGRKRDSFRKRAESVGIDLDAQLNELRVELDSIRPNVILGLGGTPLWALTGNYGIGDYRGSILRGMGYKFIPTYNPAHLFHQAQGAEFIGYWNRRVIVHDMKRAWNDRLTPDMNIPNRLLQVCKNSFELHEFIQRYRSNVYLSVDIESGGHCLPICVGLSFTPSHGMCVPLWNRDGISDIPSSDLATIWRMLAELLWEKSIIGQNFNFDRDKLVRLGFAVKSVKSDVMLKAFTVNPELPKGLAFNTSIYTREPFYKNDEMYEGSRKDLFIGCARDACVTLEIDEKMEVNLEELSLKKFYYNFVMTLPDFYLEIQNNGFEIDRDRRDELIRKYVAWDEQLGFEMFQIAGVDINVNSPTQVYDFLFNIWKLPRREGTGEEELFELLNLKNGVPDPGMREWIEKCLERRRVKKTINTYLMAIPDYDGKMKTTCYMCLETGRTSTGQQDPPIRPKVDIVGKGNKKDMKVMGTAFQVFTKHGDIGGDVRQMYRPDEGEIFVQLDGSQAEARVIFNLAMDEQALKDIDEHDYHALTATWFFGGVESDYSKKVLGYESPIRFAGKTLRHAGHLGAGKRRASIEFNTQARKNKMPISITEMKAEQALKIFHAKQPRIRGVFHKEVIDILNSTRRLVAPLPYGIDAPCGGIRTFYERAGGDLERQALSYLPQRAVSDHTKAAGIRIKRIFPDAKIIVEAHDGLLFAIRKDWLDEFSTTAKKEMERPINFTACSLPRRFLKIPCDIEIGENYGDLKKYKSPQIPSAELIQEIKELTLTDRFMMKD